MSKQISISLDPCPFCGNDRPCLNYLGVGSHLVECGNDDCGAFGPDGDDEGEAVAKWNTRLLALRDEGRA